MSELSRLTEGHTQTGYAVHAARWVRVKNAGGWYSLCGRRVHVPVPTSPVADGGVSCKNCQHALLSIAANEVEEAARIFSAYDSWGR